MDIDDRIKDIRAQDFFPDSDSLFCKLCGQRLPYTFEHHEEEGDDFVCFQCLTWMVDIRKNRVYQGIIKKFSKPRCGYCFKARKLFGKWCRECRDEKHRRDIKELLAKKMLDSEDQKLFEYYQQQSIWKKEFKKKHG